jgi:glyoxylase-like metal-dependent hydrolase (beta-lactamase superfamily II)
MPGHTPGTQAVVLGGRIAFAGDMILGGRLGGALSPGSPGEPYFQADPAANHRDLQVLVDRGVQLFLLGHGGPVTRSAVVAAFRLRGGRMTPLSAGRQRGS